MHLALSLLTRASSLWLAFAEQVLRKRLVFQKSRICGAVCLAVLGMVVAGCGSGSGSGAKAGAILIASSSGATAKITSLAVATTANLSMIPTGDSINAGVDWTVTCGGNPVSGSVTNGACGTLTPVHTADGATTVFTAPPVVPIGTTVTIMASVTSNPSQSSSVSLSIVPLSIAVSFLSPAPSSLVVNGTTGLSALAANDAANAGVIWTASCGSSACGSFNPTQTGAAGSVTSSTIYTAPPTVPPGGTVTVTATSLTDTTKSVSATITITPLPPPLAIGVSISPVSFYAQTTGAARLVRVAAVVTNDTAAAGVDWKLTCGTASCGQIPAHTASGSAVNYSAPSSVPQGGTVTLTATSTTDPTVSATATATILTTAPILVTIPSSSSLPATLMVGSQATLAATVANDTGKLGVNWSATCGSAGACGSFNLSPAHTASGGQIVYTAPAAIPAGGLVTITASSPASTPSNPAITTTTIIAQPPAISFLQSPPAALVSTTQAPVSAAVANDVASGGVTWSVQCNSGVAGGCGYIAPNQTASGATAIYTAPPVTSTGTSVTIQATSTADPQMSASSAPIAINPSTSLTVNFIPSAPSQIPTNTIVNLSAAVANDSTNGGVDWKVCASGCGSFTIQAAIQPTATTPFVPAVTATTVTGWSNNLLLPYTAPLQVPASGSVVVLVAAHASPVVANSATVAITSATTGPALHGIVQAGTQPVVGASVALYAAGTSGYGSAASQVFAPGGASTVTTDSNGNFTVLAGYDCPQPNSQMYLVATDGHVGANGTNQNLSLMTALGSCSALSSSPVVVNEVTSVASAYATAPFASNDALTGKSSYLYLGTSSTNVTGLANAFASVNNLVDITTGQARYMVPAGNAAVPYLQINTLADVLNACAASSGGVYGDGSACSTVFTYTAVLQQNSLPTSFFAFAPADTLQAMFNIAQHPVSAYGYQLVRANSPLGLATGASPFQPILTALPNDWSLSLNYTGGGGLPAVSGVGSFAVDATGNLWITDTKAGSVVEWNTVGAALSPPTGFPAGGGPIAIDATGNVWISGDGSLTELTNLGLPVPGSPFGGVAGGGSDIAIDAQSNLWITTGSGVAEFNSLGAAISPSSGYTNDGVTQVTAVDIDSSNNVWVGNRNPAAPSGGYFAELTNPGGQLIVDTSGVDPVLPGIAADNTGSIWAVGATSVCKVPPYGGKGTTLLASCQAGGGSGNGTGALSFVNPAGITLDGAGIVWVASSGGVGANNPSVPPNVLPINPSLPMDTTPYLVSQSLSAGTVRLAADGSGNLWVLLANGTVTEYVGLATPVVTPIAFGVMHKKLAATP